MVAACRPSASAVGICSSAPAIPYSPSTSHRSNSTLLVAMSEIHELTAGELLRRYRRRELSPVEVVRDVLARIERFNPIVNAFLLVDAQGALDSARASEARWASGTPAGLVDGVPATVKDNIWAKGWP